MQALPSFFHQIPMPESVMGRDGNILVRIPIPLRFFCRRIRKMIRKIFAGCIVLTRAADGAAQPISEDFNALRHKRLLHIAEGLELGLIRENSPEVNEILMGPEDLESGKRIVESDLRTPQKPSWMDAGDEETKGKEPLGIGSRKTILQNLTKDPILHPKESDRNAPGDRFPGGVSMKWVSGFGFMRFFRFCPSE